MTNREDEQRVWEVGDQVIKTGGDYVFSGEVRAVFSKRSGQVRVVVENPDGILHIFNPRQLERRA
jgi:hypothetical protein